jgi:hypothetical protein
LLELEAEAQRPSSSGLSGNGTKPTTLFSNYLTFDVDQDIVHFRGERFRCCDKNTAASGMRLALRWLHAVRTTWHLPLPLALSMFEEHFEVDPHQTPVAKVLP